MDNRHNRGRGRFSSRKKSKPFAGQPGVTPQRDVRLDGFRPFTDNVPAAPEIKPARSSFFWKGRIVPKPDHEKLYIPCPSYADIPVVKHNVGEDGVDIEAERTNMTEIVGVRFRAAGKVYYFLPVTSDGKYIRTKSGDNVIVDTARGLEYGSVFVPNKFITNDKLEQLQPMRHIVRLATPEDDKIYRENLEVEKRAESVFVEKAAAHGLPMKLIDIQYTFDHTKILFFFSSEGRVDFRELVKDLAAIFHTRIELRQIGIRDEARIMGGLGACGRPLCCSTFLSDFVQVSIKMAKSQIVSLNPSKISGCCGRLMCCLRYENDTYEQEIAKTPPVDAIVKTPDGYGVVSEIHPLAATVKVKLVEKGDVQNPVYSRDDVEIVSGTDEGYLAALERAQKQLADRAVRAPAATKTEAPSTASSAGSRQHPRAEAPVTKISSQGLFLAEDGEQAATEPKPSGSKSRHKSRHKKNHSAQQAQKSAEATAPKAAEPKSGEPKAGEGAKGESRPKPQSGHSKKHHSHSGKSARPDGTDTAPKAVKHEKESQSPAEAPRPDGQQNRSRSHHRRHHHKKSSGHGTQGGTGK